MWCADEATVWWRKQMNQEHSGLTVHYHIEYNYTATIRAFPKYSIEQSYIFIRNKSELILPSIVSIGFTWICILKIALSCEVQI